MAPKAKHKPVPGSTYNGRGVPVAPGSASGVGKGSIPKRLLSMAASGDGADFQHPLWRLSLLDREYEGTWSWRMINGETTERIIAFLSEMERLSWKEIRGQITGGQRRRGSKHKHIPVDHLAPDARARFDQLELDEFDEMFRFRLSGPERLWGVISDEIPRVFYPIWWDPEHKICPGKDKE